MHISGKTAVVGHTPQVEGDIRDLGHIKMIDTYCYGDQWLTALDVDSGQYWQANNWGGFRTGNLDAQEDANYDNDLPKPPAT